jgi:protein gp37
MSDLFHRDVPDDFILNVFGVMAQADWHIYQVLTKRPSRLVSLVPRITNYLANIQAGAREWPTNIWMGVSVETLQYQWRIDQLRKVPAHVRFVSAEPLLGSLKGLNLEAIHWLIAGGESGPGFRACNPTWIRELRAQCRKSKVSFFFKQWGGLTPTAGGRILDGRTWDEMPKPKRKELLKSFESSGAGSPRLRPAT